MYSKFNNSQNPIKVYISYKWQDSIRNNWVEKLYKNLRKNSIDAKLEKYEVAVGDSFVEFMKNGIKDADFLLLIITPEAIKAIDAGKGAIAEELKFAREKLYVKGHSFKIIIILREGSRIPNIGTGLRYIDFKRDKNYKKQLKILIESLKDKIKPPPLKFSNNDINSQNLKKESNIYFEEPIINNKFDFSELKLVVRIIIGGAGF